MSSVSKRRKEGSRTKIKTMGDHKEFLKRITKSLYYGQLPSLPCLSLPVTEISCELWSVAQRGRSLRRLHADAAADIARAACVSPCALVLAILYLERLKRCNPDYLSAAAPADLFLVSLMVSNKFLQDDGEDDEVICSEWAASGGLELNELKKLEMEFLNAIEWKIFVSEESFEAGLSWLEREVALRQARARGFFTYADLTAAADAALAGRLARAAHPAVALAAACIAALPALLTSALLLANACLPPLDQLHRLASDVTALAASADSPPDAPPELSNATAGPLAYELPELSSGPDNLRCCDEWMRHREQAESKKKWYDAVADDWKPLEPWWSRTSVLNWLYQSSLVNPMQRWLEKMNQYSDLLRKEFYNLKSQNERPPCGAHRDLNDRNCARQWLNLSKLNIFVASMSDR